MKKNIYQILINILFCLSSIYKIIVIWNMNLYNISYYYLQYIYYLLAIFKNTYSTCINIYKVIQFKLILILKILGKIILQ